MYLAVQQKLRYTYIHMYITRVNSSPDSAHRKKAEQRCILKLGQNCLPPE